MGKSARFKAYPAFDVGQLGTFDLADIPGQNFRHGIERVFALIARQTDTGNRFWKWNFQADLFDLKDNVLKRNVVQFLETK